MGRKEEKKEDVKEEGGGRVDGWLKVRGAKGQAGEET